VKVTRKLVLPTQRDEVWEALTNPERLEEWFANDVDFDLNEGGGRFAGRAARSAWRSSRRQSSSGASRFGGGTRRSASRPRAKSSSRSRTTRPELS
jgi:hypothetical protein